VKSNSLTKIEFVVNLFIGAGIGLSHVSSPGCRRKEEGEAAAPARYRITRRP